MDDLDKIIERWKKEEEKRGPIKTWIYNHTLAGYNGLAFFRNPFLIAEIPGYYYRQVKWFIQRGKRGYSDADSWDLAYYIADWMPAAIRRMQEYRNSHPANVDSIEEWKAILEEIAVGFDIADCIGKHDYELEEYDNMYAQFLKSMDLFVKYYFDLWD